jgi:hypothetical protein
MPTALVTGASSGIGREFAELLAADGTDLVVLARSEDRLRELSHRLQREYGVTVTAVVKDLADPDAPRETAEALAARDITVDVLVNNAGFGTHGSFAESDLDTELDEIQVNVTAVTELTRRFLPGLLERDEGAVVNVASTAAFQPGPLMAVYYATKAYVLHFSEGLSEEVAESGVTVTALCPGPTETNFEARAGVGDTALFDRGTMDARTVARAGYRGMKRGEAVVVPGLRNRLTTLLVRLIPRSTVRRVAMRLHDTR